MTSDLELSVVGTAGFEPTTPCSQSRCATKLRYVPCRTRLADGCVGPVEVQVGHRAPG